MEYSDKMRGVVKSMREDYDDKTKVSVEIELPAPKAKKVAKGENGSPMATPYKPTRSICVSQEMAASLSIGDPVEVETQIRPFGKRSAGAAVQAEKAGEVKEAKS